MKNLLQKLGGTLIGIAIAFTPLAANATTFIVPQGGTGAGSFSAHAVLLGNGTSAFGAASPGTAGNVLTSNGAGADPTFQSVAGAFSTTSAAYWLTTKTTDNLTEGASNLYWTTARFITAFDNRLSATTTLPNIITLANLALPTTQLTGTITNAQLANSTISGISLGSTLAALSATNGTLTFTGSYTGATARTVGLNLGNANTWTVGQTFSPGVGVAGIINNGLEGIGTSTPEWALTVASSTGAQLTLADGSATSAPFNFRSINGNFYLSTSSPTTFATSTTPILSINAGGVAGLLGIATSSPYAEVSIHAPAGTTPFAIGSSTQTLFSVNTLGKTVGFDIVNGWSGILSPTHTIGLNTGTSTTWTATTSGAYIAQWVAPYPGTIKNVRCSLDGSFLGVNIQVAGSNVTPSYFVASSTVGIIAFTATNTFTAGQVITASFGTTTTASTLRASCTLTAVET